jgi:hypothetical protein
MLERRLREAEEEGKGVGAGMGVDEVFEVGVGGVSPPLFRGMSALGEGGGGSPRGGDVKVLDLPRATNTSWSGIRQPRRPNTSDSGAFALALPI